MVAYLPSPYSNLLPVQPEPLTQVFYFYSFGPSRESVQDSVIC